MKRVRRWRPARLTAVVALMALSAVGLMQMGGERREDPAPQAALDRIAAKNRKATVEAAAVFKAKAAAARAAERESGLAPQAADVPDRPASAR